MTFRTWKGGTEGSSLLCFTWTIHDSRILRKNIPQSRFGRAEDVETRRKHTQKWSYGRRWLRFSSFLNLPHVGLTCHTWHHRWCHQWCHPSPRLVDMSNVTSSMTLSNCSFICLWLFGIYEKITEMLYFFQLFFYISMIVL